MGLLLLGSSWSPSFKISEISAIFQACGKILLVNEAIIIDVISGRIVGRLSLIM